MSTARPLTIFVPHCSELLTDHQPHGDGLVAHGFIRHLARRGHTLYVAAPAVDLQEPLPDNVHVFEFPARGKHAAWSRLDYMLQVRALLTRLRRRVCFDIVHQLNPVFTGVSLALTGSGIPLVLGPYVGQWPSDPGAMTSSRASVRTTLRRCRDAIAGLQQGTADVLLLTTAAAVDRVPFAGRLKRRIHILPHGMDSHLFAPAAEDSTVTSPAPGHGEILFLASVAQRKGIYDLLAAFERIAARFPHAKLIIAGAGPELPEVKRRARVLSCHDRIQFLGGQTRRGAASLFQRAEIYCLPSHGEPYGMTAAEAMSCGKPVIATDAGGLGCLIDEQGGIRVPVGDPETLAAALGSLLMNPARRQAMGEHNRRRVLASMTWERVVERLESIYEITIARKNQAAGKRSRTSTQHEISSAKEHA